MWAIRWSLIGAIILTLLAMVMINTDSISVSLIGAKPIEIPIYLLFYSFFALGMILIAVKDEITKGIENYWNSKAFKDLRRERDKGYTELGRLREEIDWYREEIRNFGIDPDLVKLNKIKEKKDKQDRIEDENQIDTEIE